MSTGMGTIKFKVVPCELNDMLECVEIFHDAFDGDPVMIHQYSGCDSQALKREFLRQHEIDYGTPETHFFKAVREETG